MSEGFKRQGYQRSYYKRPSLRYRINENITVSPVRLVDHESKQIGVMTKDEALVLAKEKGIDAVLINHQANPPVVKLIDFNKFLYQEQKKQQEAKKHQKKSTLKTVSLSLFIGQGDLERLVRKTKEFIKDGYQVKIGLLLKGREMGKKQMGFDLVNRFLSMIEEGTFALLPKLQGRVIIAIITRKKHE